jgi:acylglycerol lipase
MTQGIAKRAREGTFQSTEGLRIFFRSWLPDGPARGTVAIVPGFNAHSGYYDWVAGQLVAAGLAVFAVDLRGRGQSDGERFYVTKFSEYVDDVAGLVSQAKSQDPELPVFLLGHSAGGVVSCLYALDHQQELAGLICESFAFQVPAPDFALAVFKGLSHIAPHVHVLHLKNEDFSRDPEVVSRMKRGSAARPRDTTDANPRGDGPGRRAFEAVVRTVHAAGAHSAWHVGQGDEACRQPVLLRTSRLGGQDPKALRRVLPRPAQ